MLTPKRLAAALRDSPPKTTASTTRLRRSSESAIPAASFPRQESSIRIHPIRESPSRFSPFGYRSSVQCDCGVENLGDRAVLLGIAGHPSERGLIEVRHLGAQRQSRPTDAESLTLRLKSDRSLGRELGRRKACALQLKGERHGEASGMGGGDQLFGVGAPLVLEPGPERIRGLCEHAGIGGKIAAAVAARAAPNRFRLAYHGPSPCNCVF